MKKNILIIIAITVTILTIIKTILITFSFISFSNKMITNESTLIRDILHNFENKTISVIKKNDNIIDIKETNIYTQNIKYDFSKMQIITTIPYKNRYIQIIYDGRYFYKQLIISIFQIVLLALTSLIIIILVINYFLNPYLELLEQLKENTYQILKGNFSSELKVNNLKGDAKLFLEDYNKFLHTLKDSFGVIEEKYTTLIEKEKSDNPLQDAKETIEYLADIFKFKRLIEDDISTKDIFNRLVEIIGYFGIKNFSLIAIDTNEKTSYEVYTKGDICCNILDNYQNCRAFRTKKNVNSLQFEHICNMHYCDNKYICIPFNTSGSLNAILKLNLSNDEIENINKKLPFIKAYLNEVASIIESKHTLELLHQQSVKDTLTKLFNRRYLDEVLPTIIAAANRSKQKIGFLMVDMDHFKKVNDTYGHDAGDIALKTLAKVLVSSVRKSDIVIRYGGEEFLIILQNIKSIEDLKKVAEKIRQNVEKQIIDLGEEQIKKTVSIGGSIYPDYCEDSDECIKQADVALYEAKNKGRNRVEIFHNSLKEKHS